MTLARLKFNFIAFITAISALCLAGCGNPLKSTPGFGFLDASPVSSTPGIIKKVGLMPLINMTEYQEAAIMDPLETKLYGAMASVCTDTIFINPRGNSAPAFLADPPLSPTGLIDSLKLARQCRQVGLNMVLRASVTNISYEKEMSWYNWIVRDDDTIYLNIRIALFDTHTGTKLFHDTFMEELEIKPLDVDALTIPEIMALPGFEKLSSKIIEDIVEKICKTVLETPWKGYIVSADGSKGVLSSGSEVGIKTSDVLKVYKNNGVIRGFGGLDYIIPGPVVDQVRVTAVTKNTADIVSTSGRALNTDLVVQY